MTAFNAPVTAMSAELSIAAAMGGIRLAPAQLEGTLRSGLKIADVNSARLEGWARAEAKRAKLAAEALEREIAEDRERALAWDRRQAERLAEEKRAEISLAEGETLVEDLREDSVLVEVEDDIAEVVALISDASGTWVRVIPAETGEPLDIHEDNWEAEFGTDGENAILTAWDRHCVAAIRREFVAA